MMLKELPRIKPEDCYNTEDPISFELLVDIQPEKLFGLRIGDKLFGFDIDGLFRLARKSRNLNPITNQPLTPLELCLIGQKYIDAHRDDGIVTIQINSEKGWDYGLLVLVVGDFKIVTVGQLVAPVLEAAAEAGIDDFPIHDLVPLTFIYAGRELSKPTKLKLSDIPAFVSGHKITISQ